MRVGKCVRGVSASNDGRLLKCRSSPSFAGLAVDALADGDVLDIECQTHGIMSVNSEFEPQCSSVEAT
ncbi:hypothetical protein IW145_000949 [Coemansia sp. RSA 521]|nr:hypothetical protein IW145_000949 [Coemansia sp. RSA 521]